MGLTFVVEMSIALELLLMYISTLPPGGQLGYKAHTAVVKRNVQSLASSLPRSPESLGAHLCTIR